MISGLFAVHGFTLPSYGNAWHGATYNARMTKASNLTAIEETTRHDWDDWVGYLDGHGARDLAHRAIADLAYARLKDSLDNPGWWAQSVAVAYEQHIGRRQPGQRGDGTFEAAVSRTVSGMMDEAMQLWLDYIAGRADVDGVAITGEPVSTQPARGRHWAVDLADGSRLNADVYPKSDDKCSLTITHAKLTNPEDAEHWRTHWKAVLADIMA